MGGRSGPAGHMNRQWMLCSQGRSWAEEGTPGGSRQSGTRDRWNQCEVGRGRAVWRGLAGHPRWGQGDAHSETWQKTATSAGTYTPAHRAGRVCASCKPKVHHDHVVKYAWVTKYTEHLRGRSDHRERSSKRLIYNNYYEVIQHSLHSC
jgi:hypothetical protein